MANVMFKKGLLANLPSTYTEGTFYVATDERAIYLDVDGSNRIRLGDFIEVANIAALPEGANANALYYVTDINCLAKWNGSEWIQINRDTGATSVEVVGSGNAVTAAAYDAATRKLTLTMGETFATAAELAQADEDIRAYVDEKTSGIATDAALGELQADVDELEKVSHSHENAEVLNGITAEKVAAWDGAEQAAKDYADEAIDALNLGETYEAKGAAAAVRGETTATVKSVEDALASYQTTNDEAVAAAKKTGDDAMVEAQKKVASVAAGDASVTVGGTDTAPTVAAKLSADADNALVLAEDGLKVVIPAAAEYSIVKAADSGDYAAIYNLTKDGVVVGASINIPKDMVVKSGSVNADGDIVLVLNDEANTEIVIEASSLIEYVTSGSAAGDMVVISVSDDHKVTASITDGTITAAKLTTELQTAIGKAHNHDNKSVLDGISEQNVADWNDAVAKEHEHANKDELDLIAAGDKAKWDAAEAKAHEHANKDLLDTYTQTEANLADAVAKKHEHSNKAELDKIVEGDKAKWDAAEQNAKTYADGLASNYDAAGSAEQALNDAKAYADQAEADALSAAKTYADGLVLTWGSF